MCLSDFDFNYPFLYIFDSNDIYNRLEIQKPTNSEKGNYLKLIKIEFSVIIFIYVLI